ncbi:MAG: hypothetical protein KDD25_03410, partial [Bdellovibrionales bacterium]|nr:hypothetical protein [Bdellovibrionales bacterium]
SNKYRSKSEVYRARAHILVLGDRRPYKIEVQVQIEQRDSGGKPKSKITSYKDLSGGQWSSFGPDEDIAEQIGQIIFDYLLKASRDRNIIDDFQVF